MIKQKPIIVCDFCGEEIDTDNDYVSTTPVPNEGCSSIDYGKKFFEVDYADYCNLDCFVNMIIINHKK